MLHFFAFVVTAFASSIILQTSTNITVTVYFNSTFVSCSVEFAGRPYLASPNAGQNGAAIFSDNRWYSPGNGLTLKQVTGTLTNATLVWQTSNGLEWATSVALINDSVFFGQFFPNDIPNTKLFNSNHSTSRWPNFEFPRKHGDIVGLFFNGMWDLGTFSDDLASEYVGGIMQSGVPLTLYDRNSLDAIVLSPASQFKTSVLANNDGVLGCGVAATIEQIESGHALDFIITAHAGSVVDALHVWGDALLARGNKTRQRDDFGVLSTLGYYTDNGAYNYFASTPDKSYAAYLPHALQYFDAAQIPVSYLQLDSWWYEWGSDRGVKSWNPRKDNVTFPSGALPALNMPLQMHNRFWSKEAKSVYSSVNFDTTSGGGDGLGEAFPTRLPAGNQLRLFREIIGHAATTYGLAIYEQDWLENEFSSGLPISRLYEADSWLHAMNQAAVEVNVTIMYCMPVRSDYLISTQFAAVRSIRVSDDYWEVLINDQHTPKFSSNHQWNIGLPSLVADAVGLTVSKDTFWSSSVNSGYVHGGRAYKNARENNPHMTTLVSILSAGQVAPGDKLGNINVTLIDGVCMSNGTLLRPDRPAVPTDDIFRDMPKQTRVSNIITVTSTQIGDDIAAYYMLAVNASSPLVISQGTVRASDTRPLLIVHLASYHYMISPRLSNVSMVWLKDATARVSLQPSLAPSSAFPFDYFMFAGVVRSSSCTSTQWVLLGELGKHVPVSRDRIRSVTVAAASCNLIVSVCGEAGENVAMLAVQMLNGAPALMLQTVTIGSGGTETIEFS